MIIAARAKKKNHPHFGIELQYTRSKDEYSCLNCHISVMLGAHFSQFNAVG